MAKKKTKLQESDDSYGSFGPRSSPLCPAPREGWINPESKQKDYIRCQKCQKAISTCEFDFSDSSIPRYVPCCDDCSEEEIDQLDEHLMVLRKMVNPERYFDMHGFAVKMLTLMELVVERLQEDDD
jgi:hypothetical protein